MKREIKFRQPITDSKGVFKEWFYWGFIDGDFITPALQTNGYDSRKESQQFTGLHDKNGKEIWESDILNVPYNRIGNHIVEWHYGQWSIKGYDLKSCEVIGNVHEHKHLL